MCVCVCVRKVVEGENVCEKEEKRDGVDKRMRLLFKNALYCGLFAWHGPCALLEMT